MLVFYSMYQIDASTMYVQTVKNKIHASTIYMQKGLSLKYGLRSAECAEPIKCGTTESAPKLRKKTRLIESTKKRMRNIFSSTKMRNLADFQ